MEDSLKTNIGDIRVALTGIINSHNLENGSNTPDFILARYLLRCLDAFDATTKERDRWWGHAIGREPLTKGEEGVTWEPATKEEKGT